MVVVVGDWLIIVSRPTFSSPVADPGEDEGDASPTGTHSAPKLAILRSKIGKKNSGEEAQPPPIPLPHGEGYPLPTLHPSASTTSPSTNDFWIRHALLCRGHSFLSYRPSAERQKNRWPLLNVLLPSQIDIVGVL